MTHYLPILSRCLAAIVGGYGIATLFSVAVLVLPWSSTEVVLAGMVGSFLIYTIAVIWVFAVRSAWRAWAGLLIGSVWLLPPAAWIWWGNGI